MKDKLEEYFKLQKEIYEYFGYVEDWVVIPIVDRTQYYWMICGPEDDSSTSVSFSEKPFTQELIEDGKEIYGDTIYTQCFLSKWVYRVNDYTMICVDTHTDGNKFLAIFNNLLECKDEEMKKIYNECW